MKAKTQSAKLKVGCAVRRRRKRKSKGKRQKAKGKGQRVKGKGKKLYLQECLPRKQETTTLQCQPHYLSLARLPTLIC
ncbi:MAG: hypothetical protein ABSH01_06115 [Terriglobia bacterium]|jgi:hypothetical protein